MPRGLPNGSQGTRKWTPASPVTRMRYKSKPESNQLGTQPAVTSTPASHQSQNRGRQQGAKPLIYIYIYIYIHIYTYIYTECKYICSYICIYCICTFRCDPICVYTPSMRIYIERDREIEREVHYVMYACTYDTHDIS